MLSLYSRYRTVPNLNKYSCTIGCPQVLTSAGTALISTIIHYWSSIYLDELQSKLWAKHHKYITFSTLLQTLQWPSIIQKIIATGVPDLNIIFIDKAVKDKQPSTHQYGWSMRGVHCCIKTCFVHGMRFSIIPAITLNGIITYDITERLVDGKISWVFWKDMWCLVIMMFLCIPH